MESQRFPIRRDFLYRGLLLFIGATAKRSWAELGEEGLSVKFGSYEEHFRYEEIESVRERDWKLLYGIGVRYTPDEAVGFVGSRKGVVELMLRKEREFNILLTVTVKKFAVSLQDPADFIAALQARLSE